MNIYPAVRKRIKKVQQLCPSPVPFAYETAFRFYTGRNTFSEEKIRDYRIAKQKMVTFIF